MNNLGEKNLSAILIAVVILTIFFIAGCQDSEMAKGITDTVKKSVEGEVAKKGEEIKKQFDRVINPGSGQKEEGQGTAVADKENSEKDSGDESAEEND